MESTNQPGVPTFSLLFLEDGSLIIACSRPNGIAVVY